MSVNRGKGFESMIHEAFDKVPNTETYRVPDQMTYRYGSKNPCDFFVYHKPYLYAIECKSVHGNLLPFSNISENQWKELLRMSAVDGVFAGIMCWYVDRARTVFLPIQYLEMLRQNGAKSLRFDVEDKEIIDIEARKKRVYWEYNMSSFFQSIEHS